MPYAVANMPGAVPVTSTRALPNATGELVQRLADESVRRSLEEHPGLRAGLTTEGLIAQPAVAAEFADLPSAAAVAA